jgi:tetrahydromethanopterin S-methyltransferase subunit D
MRQNPEFFLVIAFGAALILGLSGAPAWMPLAIGVMYGIDELLAAGSGTTGGVRARHSAVRQQVGMIAARAGAILTAYGFALTLRHLGGS